jgi:hypothetical protein
VANEFANDAAFVDLLLHTRDRAYSVPQLVTLIESSGLAFQDWEDNRYYFADTHFGSESQVAKILRAVPQQDQWAIVDNLLMQALHHSFLACHPERRESRCPLFDSEAILDSFPLRRPEVRLAHEGADYILTRPSVRTRLTQAEGFLMTMADGTCSLRDIVAHPAWTAHPEADRLEFTKEWARRMWQRGNIFLSRIRCSA